jgi:KUP system potassium uptake protein
MVISRLRMNAHADPDAHGGRSSLLPLTLSAVGVVYGDIGTSPLYAIRECFFGSHSVPPTHENVLGVLSLIIYALLIVISIKYIVVVMRADNQGEGGILALTALIPGRDGKRQETRGVALGRPILIGLGIVGASLLYGDGMITPAITVLSAIEGLEVATPFLKPYVVPVSVAILLFIFVIQQYGTHRIGRLFGPIMVVWFTTIAVLGLTWIMRMPSVLGAVDPRHAFIFFSENGGQGFAVLGAVLLAVTGAEALYADMGHFGKRPIRLAWFALVLPALVLNYFGQGALLLIDGKASQPFFQLAPSWALLPLVLLAAVAAVIASQALISGAFSLTRQAIQLGYAPRLDIEHTSSFEIGQVYVPQVNWFLACSTIVIVIGFRSSSSLAAAYGIANTMTMVITTLLLYVIATERWKWPLSLALGVTAVFLSIDLAFLGANLLKILHGGWLPLVIAALLFTLMTTWKTGRRLVSERLTARAFPLEDFVAAIAATPPTRVSGTAVFMTAQPRGTPPALAHNLRYNKILHERVIVLTVTTAPVPSVAPADQISVQSYGHGLYNVRARYGFMQDPNVPEALALAHKAGVEMDLDDVIYFLGRETIIITENRGMAKWRERIFVLIARNAVRATAFFRLPPERVVELGVQVEM